LFADISRLVQYKYSGDHSQAATLVCTQGLRPAEHHLHDINDRLSPHARNTLDMIEGELPKVVPGIAKEHLQVITNVRRRGYQAMGKYLMGNQEYIFPGDKFYCCCVKHIPGFCSVRLTRPEASKALTMNIAGSTCIGFSPLGTHAGHASMRDLHVWAASMRALKPTFIIWECAANLPKDVLQWWFEECL
jgi:hypothetical protein